MTITPSQTTINSRRDKVENKGDLIKTIVSDLYAKQADILQLKQEMDAEYFVHESAGGACYSNSSADLRDFEKVPTLSPYPIECADGRRIHGRLYLPCHRSNLHASV